MTSPFSRVTTLLLLSTPFIFLSGFLLGTTTNSSTPSASLFSARRIIDPHPDDNATSNLDIT